MIPYRDAMDLSQDQIESIRKLVDGDTRIEVIYLFGSRARGEAAQESDYDFAFRVSTPLSLTEQAEINAKLMKITHCSQVDTIFLHEAPILLKFEAVSGGRIIFSRIDPDAVNRYEMSIYREYFHTERFRRLQRESLKEEFGA